jgi:hypothetical protein
MGVLLPSLRTHFTGLPSQEGCCIRKTTFLLGVAATFSWAGAPETGRAPEIEKKENKVLAESDFFPSLV